MDARELRIGNYIQYFGNVAQVEGIVNESNGFGLQLNGGDFASINSNSLEPIPLTEEWLLKFGFTSEGEGCEAWLDLKNEIENNKVQLRTWINFECFQEYNGTAFFMLENYEGDDYTTIIPRKFKYVHQLQNLYFALTREELTIKNK